MWGVGVKPTDCSLCIQHDVSCHMQTQTLSGPSLAQLASLFVEAIKLGKMGTGKSLELFPSVLTALTACDTLSYGKGECRSPVCFDSSYSTRGTFSKMFSECRGTQRGGIQETSDQQPVLQSVRTRSPPPHSHGTSAERHLLVFFCFTDGIRDV